MPKTNRESVFDAIDDERDFQDQKWGTIEDHPHEVGGWLTIMRSLLLKAEIRRDRDDRPKSFESVEHITPLDPLDTETRLNELAQLQDGWLDGKGRALDRAGIKDLAEAFDKYFDPDLPLPYLYPTTEGGIQSEWTLGGWEVSLEIALPTLVAEYQSLNMETGEVREHEMKLVTKDDWSCLNNALATLRDGG